MTAECGYEGYPAVGGTSETAYPQQADPGVIQQFSVLNFDGYNWAHYSLYNNPSSFAAIAGDWTGNLVSSIAGTLSPTGSGVGAGVLSIDSNGVMFE
jgi:filamentous hemagglutinin family protein